MSWGGKRCNCGRKKAEKAFKKDRRSKELKATMKRNTEINDKHFAKQVRGKVKPKFKIYRANVYWGE